MAAEAGQESQRVAALARYEILDTPPDGAFDRIAALAARWFNTPIATVTIVDEDRIWFKAAYGLDGVSQVGRDPGLCASAVLQDAPYVITDALQDPLTAQNPLVRGELGVRFYAAAPIITADGHRLGTVNVLDTQPREITEAGLQTLRDLAAVVMEQLELRLSALRTVRAERQSREQADRHRTEIEIYAATLQRTLLPPALPDVPGLELACHYHAASPAQVGGDFYDVFHLWGGRWAFFIGDVCGHGAPAAALTSLTRYSLRSAAMHDPDPISVLTELNAALLKEPDSQALFTTVMYGVLQPDPTSGGFDITLGTGGHEPALKLTTPPTHNPGTVVTEVLPEPTGMLVGAIPDATFAALHVHLEPGQALLLYTDGLTEARDAEHFFGPDGLAQFLTTRPHSNAHQLIDDLTNRIAQFDPPPNDDIALLAMSVPAPPASS